MTDADLLNALERSSLLEAKVADLYARLGAAVPSFDMRSSAPEGPELTQLMQSGDTTGAIKRYRELTGFGLAEAKSDIDRLMP